MAYDHRRWGQPTVRRYVVESAWKELPWATATAVHPSGFAGFGLVFLNQDESHKVRCDSCVMQACVDWKLLRTLHKSGHLGEAVAIAYVMAQRQGRMCQPRAKLIQATSTARKFDIDMLTDSTLKLFLLANTPEIVEATNSSWLKWQLAPKCPQFASAKYLENSEKYQEKRLSIERVATPKSHSSS
ncbi:hypothetical protein BTVI_02744 [Pitangus sulphuratus]|nr:hypothetical protein BTVI_02744 [Pitangus sulphuratus]